MPELEGHQPARLGGLRPVRQRQDGAQGERQPRRRAGLDPLRRPPTTRPARVDTRPAASWNDANSNFVARLRPAATCASRTARCLRVADARTSATPAVDDLLRSAHHERLGRAAVELGVLGRRPAGDPAAPVGDRSATSAASTATSHHRQRGAGAGGLHAVQRRRCRPTRACRTAGRDDQRLLRPEPRASRTATSSRTRRTSASSRRTGTASTSRRRAAAQRLFLQGGSAPARR